MVTTAFSIEEELQKLLDQQFANDQGIIGVLPSNVSPFFRMEATGGVRPSTELIRYYPERDLGATYDVPLLESGIPTIQNPSASQSLGFDTSFGVANEADEEQVESLDSDEPSGIAKLFQTLLGFAIPGAGFLMNLGGNGRQGIKNLNQKIRQSDFGQSRTGAEYMMRRRERKQAERAQEAMPDVYRSAREQGFTNDRGGFSTSREDRAGTSLGSGQFSSKRSTGRQGY